MVLDLSMFYLMVPLVAGVLSGFLLRDKKCVSLNRVTFGIILVLIFSLGFTIGSNKDLLTSIPNVGFTALVMALLAIGFSVFFVVLIRKRLRM